MDKPFNSCELSVIALGKALTDGAIRLDGTLYAEVYNTVISATSIDAAWTPPDGLWISFEADCVRKP